MNHEKTNQTNPMALLNIIPGIESDWVTVFSIPVTLGVVHILRNHFWGSPETPPLLCNIVIIWAYPPYVIL